MDFDKRCGYKNNIHNNINNKIQENIPGISTGLFMTDLIHICLKEKQRR